MEEKEEALIKDKNLWIIIGLCFIYLMMVLSVPRGELSDLEKTKMLKLRDFYLVYNMWTDEEYRNVNGK